MRDVLAWLADERGEIAQSLVNTGMWVAIGVILVSALGGVLRARANTIANQINSISTNNFVTP
jgi:hypothetical protein